MATTPTPPAGTLAGGAPTPAPAALPTATPAPTATLTPTARLVTPRQRQPRQRPPVRVAYTRHATAGQEDDQIVNMAWYNFLKAVLWIGGIAILGWVLFGGFQIGRATAPESTTPAATPIVVSNPSPAPTPTPVPPQVIQPVVVQPVVIQPPAPVVNVGVPPQAGPQVESPQPRAKTDAEIRNEALKEKLRERYRLPSQ